MTAPRKPSRSSLAIEYESLQLRYAELQETLKEMSDRFYSLSLSLAQREYGQDRVNAAMHALLSNAPPEVQWGISREDHPFDSVVAWHRAWGMH
jgi:hypothetical protein